LNHAGTTKDFAEDLAKATGIEAQVLEETAQPKRKRIPPKAKPAGKLLAV